MKPLALMGTASFFVFLWFTLFGMINVLKNKKDIVDSRIKLLKKIFQIGKTPSEFETLKGLRNKKSGKKLPLSIFISFCFVVLSVALVLAPSSLSFAFGTYLLFSVPSVCFPEFERGFFSHRG